MSQPLELLGRGPGVCRGLGRTLCLDLLGRFADRIGRVAQALAGAVGEALILTSQIAQPLGLLDCLLLALGGIDREMGPTALSLGLAGAGSWLELFGELHALALASLRRSFSRLGQLSFLLVLRRTAEILLLLTVERPAGAGLLRLLWLSSLRRFRRALTRAASAVSSWGRAAASCFPARAALGQLHGGNGFRERRDRLASLGDAIGKAVGGVREFLLRFHEAANHLSGGLGRPVHEQTCD